MTIEQRQFIRFSLDIPAIRQTKYGEMIETVINQISLGGCLAEGDDNVYVGDEFRLLLQLPNKNFLPLICKALYRFADNGIGAKFVSITRFEQELIIKVITQNLEQQGLPLQVDPFSNPKTFNKNGTLLISDNLRRKEDILENILSHSE